MTLKEMIAGYQIGLTNDDGLPEIALTALEENFDSPCLRILAGRTSRDNALLLRAEYKISLSDPASKSPVAHEYEPLQFD